MDVDFKIFKINSLYFRDQPAIAAEADLKSDRVYLGVVIAIGGNNCFVPFETKLKDNALLRRYSQWPVPSSTRPEAGLNFEKCLIINNFEYLTLIENPQIANSQKREINKNKASIKAKLNRYITNYINAYNKDRHLKEFIFKFTTLHCFHKELGLTQGK